MWSRALLVPGGFQCTWAVSEIKSGIHRATIRIPDPLGCWQQGRSPKEQSHAVPRGESASLAILPSWGQSQAWPSALQTHPAPEKGLWHLPTKPPAPWQGESPTAAERNPEPPTLPFSLCACNLLCPERRDDGLRERLMVFPWTHTFVSLLRDLNCAKWSQRNYHHSGTWLAFIGGIAWYTWKFLFSAKILSPDSPRRV